MFGQTRANSVRLLLIHNFAAVDNNDALVVLRHALAREVVDNVRTSSSVVDDVDDT